MNIKNYARLKASKAAYAMGLDGNLPMPTSVYFAINSVCNSRCKMCDVGQANKGSQFYKNLISAGDMPLAVWKKAIDELKPYKPVISIVATEPLLYNELETAIRYAKTAGLKVQLTTNGLLLESWANRLAAAGLDEVFVSIDGTPDVNDVIRGIPGITNKALAGIKAAKQNGITVIVNFTISNFNYNNITAFMGLIRNVGVDLVIFSHLNWVDPTVAEVHNQKYGDIIPTTAASIIAVEPGEINTVELDRQLKDAKEYLDVIVNPDITGEELKRYYNNPFYFIKGSNCTAPWKTVHICANGDVLVSARCYSLVFGNIKERSIKDIWNDERFVAFRRTLRKNDGKLPACSRCCGVFV